MKCAIFALATVGLALTFAGDQTQAAPLAPAVSTSSNIVLAAQGCGRGWHRARYVRAGNRSKSKSETCADSLLECTLEFLC
jgi:hypothetical protein